MTDIKLVIKIEERTYTALTHTEFDAALVVDEMRKSIANGIPLPKNHGDLIDRRELIKSGVSKGFCDWYDEIKYAKPIIEADKEYKE